MTFPLPPLRRLPVLALLVTLCSCSGNRSDTNAKEDGGLGTATQEITAQPDPSCTYARYGVHDYWICDATKSFDTARAVCDGVGMHLARIDNAAENDFVEGLIKRDSWLGATDSVREGDWRWIDDNTQFWSGTHFGKAVGGLYSHWSATEPNDLFGEDCAVMVDGSGEWNDLACGLSRGFVCESSPSTDGQPQAPDTACTRSTRGDSTYWTCSNARTWDTARANCQSIGMDLVAIDDDAEQSFLAPKFTGETYLGLSDRDAEGTWRWSATGKPDYCGATGGRTPYASYSDWASGQPYRANDCTRVDSAHSTYWVCRNQVTWDAARNECSGSGMSLVRIDDATENALLASNISIDTWLGGSDSGHEGQWRWTDNVPFWSGSSTGTSVAGRYTNFQSGEPNDLFGENCLLMYQASGKWNDSMCEAPLGGIGFACEGPKDSGPPDLNDCAFATSGGRWSSGLCSKPRAYVCESLAAGAKRTLEDEATSIRETHALGAPGVMGFTVKPGIQVKEPFAGMEERLGLRACKDGLEPSGTPTTLRSSGLERVTYDQTYQGIPMFGRGYAVLRNPNTKFVTSVLGEVYPNLDVATTPTVTMAQALSKAVAAAGHATSDYNPAPAGKLMILPKKQGKSPEWELGWLFTLPATAGDTGHYVGVSAITGDVILKTNERFACVLSALPSPYVQNPITVDAPQETFYLDPNQALATLGGDPTYPTYLYSLGTTLDGQAPLSKVPTITTTCGDEALSGFAVRPDWRRVMQTFPSPIAYQDGNNPVTDEASGAAWFLAAQTSLNAMASIFDNQVAVLPANGDPTTKHLPWIGIDGFGDRAVNIHVGPGRSEYRVGVTSSDGTVEPEFVHLETAGAPTFQANGAALDVVSHELGHGIWHYLSPETNPTDLEARAIQEGYGDVLGATVEAAVRLPKSSISGEYCTGGDVSLNATCWRNHKDPTQSTDGACNLPDGSRVGCCVYDASGQNPVRGGCPSDYDGAGFCTAEDDCGDNPVTDSCCDVHTNATVFDHWQYLVTAGDAGVNSNNCAYHVDPLSSDPLTSSLAAGRIVFNAVRSGEVKDYSYPVLAEATIKAAQDLFGQDSPEVQSVVSAWYAVNVRENTFATDEAMQIYPPRGATAVNPWVTFAWRVPDDESSWDFQLDDDAFAGPNVLYEQRDIQTVRAGTPRAAYVSLALPENSSKHYVWRVRPHSTDVWSNCYAVNWFEGTGPLSKPMVTVGELNSSGQLQPGTAHVYFPQLPVFPAALGGYNVQLSPTNGACAPTPDQVVEPVTNSTFEEGGTHAVYFTGIQPDTTYYAQVQPIGPISIADGKPALGPCVTVEATTGAPAAPVVLQPVNGQRFDLYAPHERDPEVPSGPEHLQLSYVLDSWMTSSRVDLHARIDDSGGCNPAVDATIEQARPSSCEGQPACYVTVSDIPEQNAPYPGGYCFDVVGIGTNGTTSPAAHGSWRYFVDVSTARSPGAPAASGNPGALLGKTYGQDVTLLWQPVPSAIGYEARVWQFLSGYGTEQLSNPMLYAEVLGASASSALFPAAAAGLGRYCWELTPSIEDLNTPGRASYVQPELRGAGPICYTTGPSEPKIQIDNAPPSRGYTGEDVTGFVHFDYVPDERYTTNVGTDWSWADTSQPWCITYNQVYKDIVNCTRRFRVPAVEGKTVNIKVSVYDGTGAPGTKPGGTPVYTVQQPVVFGTCGGKSEACCTDSSCDNASLVCSNDTCVSCGANDQPCCKDSKCNTGNICSNSSCKACGAKDQPCCDGNSCGSGLTCAGNACTPCGDVGQPCCGTNSQCNSPLTCSGGSCTQPCTPPSTPTAEVPGQETGFCEKADVEYGNDAIFLTWTLVPGASKYEVTVTSYYATPDGTGCVTPGGVSDTQTIDSATASTNINLPVVAGLQAATWSVVAINSCGARSAPSKPLNFFVPSF